MRDEGAGRRPTRVIGYARVSSLEQALGTSLVDQQNAVKAHAAARGLKVDVFYVEAESGIGAKIERREQMQALMRDIRSGDLILVDKVDRWSRDIEFTFSSTRRIREASAKIYFVGEGIDPDTNEGDSMMNMRAMFAREEHKRIKIRTMGTRKLLRDQGLYVEGHPPIGYQRGLGKGARGGPHLKNTLQIVKDDAELVRETYRRSARGQSIGDICEWLRRHRPERSWDKKHIGHLLHNRVYLGEVKDSKGAWIKAPHLPIIEPALFARVQTGLESRRLGGAKPKGDSLTKDWLCRIIGVCGKCGAKLGAAYGAGFGKYPKYVFYYKCVRKCGARYVPVKAADEAVAALTLARLTELRYEIAKEEQAQEVAPKTIDVAVRRERLRAKHARVVESYHEGHIDKPTMLAALAKVDRDRTHLDAVEAQQKKRPVLESPEVRAELIEHVSKLKLAWSHLKAYDRRETLHDLAHRVHLVRDTDPVIDWRTPIELAEEFYT